MLLFSLFLFSFLGVVLGSFTTAIVYRLQRGQSWVFSQNKIVARSRCPYCEHPLFVIDLVPIFSWLFLKGKCRYCQEAISPQYIITEIVSASLALIVFFIFDFSAETFFCLAILPFALAQMILFFQKKFISAQLWFIMVGIIIVYIAFYWT